MVSPLSQKRHFCPEDMGKWYLQYFLVALARSRTSYIVPLSVPLSSGRLRKSSSVTVRFEGLRTPHRGHSTPGTQYFSSPHGSSTPQFIILLICSQLGSMVKRHGTLNTTINLKHKYARTPNNHMAFPCEGVQYALPVRAIPKTRLHKSQRLLGVRTVIRTGRAKMAVRTRGKYTIDVVEV